MKKNITIFIVVFITLIHISFAGGKYDFGDFSSNTLIIKASEALEKKDWKAVKVYAEKCIQLYKSQAKNMQRKLKDFPGDNESFNLWALNHVAYSHFLLGEMYMAKGKVNKAYREFSAPIKKYKYAKCFDPAQNVFWKISDRCSSKQARLEGEYGEDRFKKGSKSVKMRKLPVLNK